MEFLESPIKLGGYVPHISQLPAFVRVFAAASFLVGTMARAVPLLDPGGRALRQFASEDGYLMLTIARNLALGNGLSVELGRTATNGTQPLLTGVYAGFFWLVGGDKVWGVFLVQLLGIAIALLGAFLIYRVGLLLFGSDRNAASLAVVAAAAWYVAPLGARYTQNCLETGTAAVLPLTVGLFILGQGLGPDRVWPVRRCIQLGALLGLAFWVRNDAVLLSAAVCATLVLSAIGNGESSIRRRIFEAGCVGFTALLLVSPWLIFNYASFGNVVPVSGISQGAGTPLGENLAHVPSILAEQISIVALIPLRWEVEPVVVMASSLLVLVWIAFAYRETQNVGRAERHWLITLSVWGGLLVGFYGLIYGAGYFMGRYLFPLSPWIALLSVWLSYRLLVRIRLPRPARFGALALALVVLLSVGLDVRVFRLGMNNGHFQVVDWVEENVPEDVWVAAIQTGTLGFFHDRTYNLDGKVSPPALEARLAGRTLDYVLERPISYVVDWAGISGWLDDPLWRRHFELALLDEPKDIAVLRRRDSVDTPSN